MWTHVIVTETKNFIYKVLAQTKLYDCYSDRYMDLFTQKKINKKNKSSAHN